MYIIDAKCSKFWLVITELFVEKILETLGHTFSFIDIEPNAEDNLLAQENVEDYSHECGVGGVFAKLKKIDKYAVNRLRIRKLADEQDLAFNAFRKNVLKIDKGCNDEEFDYCVIGSDEVFNCNVASSWGFTSQLFGNVRQAKRVITYAASCGFTTYAKLADGVKERIRESFTKISAFSVRDKNTEEFVYNLTQTKPNLNLDPTLVDVLDDEMNETQLPMDLPEHYCVVYSYYNRINSEEEIKNITEFCKKMKWDIVTIGAPQMWIRNHLVLDPFQMLKVFQNADFVITDTFHGTIFSAKYAKRFATITRASNRNKLTDLVERLKVKAHLISSMGELEQAYYCEKDQSAIDEVIGKEREKALLYLKENLRV